MQIWDTSGQEKFRSLIIVYSINAEESFKHIDQWLNEKRAFTSPDIKLLLIGNKKDLVDSRKIKTEIAKQFCDERGLDFFIETSAKKRDNVVYTLAYAANILL